MEELMVKVAQLFDRKKYQKALTLLKKLNKKEPDFSSLSITASCYFHLKKYAQARLYYEQGLALASDTTQKIEILSNLAVTHVFLEQPDKAIKYYIDVISLDGSTKTAVHRDNLCRLMASKRDYHLILQYAPFLLKTADYCMAGLYYLIEASLHIPEKHSTIPLYLKRLKLELNFCTPEMAQSYVDLICSSKNTEFLKELLDILKPKYGHEDWFKLAKENQNSLGEKCVELPSIPKERVVGHNAKLIKYVDRLLTYCEELGSTFHPDLRIIESEGDLSVKVYKTGSLVEEMISIPLKGLPMLSDFDFKLNQIGHLIAEPIPAPINPDGVKTMQLLVNIYNSADKINQWKSTFPYIALSDHRELLGLLSSAKPGFEQNQIFEDLLKNDQLDKLTIESFMGSRKMLFRREALRESGINTSQELEAGLLSVIDFLNHKITTNPYFVENGKVSINGTPDKKTQELFVRYNNYDPLCTYLYYGFVDSESPHVFSVPIDITKRTGETISISSSISTIQDDWVSEELKHMRAFLPETSITNDGVIHLNKVKVPSADDYHLLRETLAIVLNTINGKKHALSASALETEVQHLEKQIIVKNIEYWRRAEFLLNSAKSSEDGQKIQALKDLEQLIGLYQSHFQKYSSKLGIGLF